MLSGECQLDQFAPPVVVAFADEDRRLDDELVADIVERALREECPLFHEQLVDQIGIEYDAEVLAGKLVRNNVAVFAVEPMQEFGKIAKALAHVTEPMSLRIRRGGYVVIE